MAKNETMNLNVKLEEESTKRFQAIKTYYGLKANDSLIALVLQNESDRIWEYKRIFIAKETYVFLQTKAGAAHLSVDEYVDHLVLLLKRVEEGQRLEKLAKQD